MESLVATYEGKLAAYGVTYIEIVLVTSIHLIQKKVDGKWQHQKVST